MRAQSIRRVVTVVTLLALMAGFGYGVNRLIASRKSKIPTGDGVHPHGDASQDCAPRHAVPGAER